MQHFRVQERFQDSGGAADAVQVVHDIAAARLQVGQMRNLAAETIEVGERPFHFGLAGDRHEMQHRVG
jgi:hypothetical protein